MKEEEYLYLLNELNMTKRLTKFVLQSNKEIKLFYSFLTDTDFTMDSAAIVLDTLVMLLGSVLSL